MMGRIATLKVSRTLPLFAWLNEHSASRNPVSKICDHGLAIRHPIGMINTYSE